MGRPTWRRLVLGTATPQRLWRLRALLVAGCLATALASGLTGWARADAVGAGGARLAALETDTSQLYRSLNEADAMATSGLAAAEPPRGIAARYDDHIARATQRLAHAASLLPPGGSDAALVERIAQLLPRYTALVEAASTLRAEGSPRVQEPLASASELMRSTILPAADALRHTQELALTANYQRASESPTAVLAIGAATLLGIGYATVRELRRTNRILNPGLVTAGVLLAVMLSWWSFATIAASDRLEAARERGAVAASLDEARVNALQARASETLAVVDGGSGEFDGDFTGQLERVLGVGGLLDTAAEQATGEATAAGIADVRAAAIEWRDAVEAGTGEDASRNAFDRLSAAMADIIGAERTALADDIRGADSVLRGTAIAPAAMAVLAGVAAAFGIGRRIREYR